MDNIIQIVDGWTQLERQDVLRALLQSRSGSLRFDDSSALVLPIFQDGIQPNSAAAVSAYPYDAFRPRRLVIFEPVIERVAEDVSCTYKDIVVSSKTTGFLWWKKTETAIERLVDTKTVTERRVNHVVPRGVWTVSGVFVGQRAQFPTTGSISGDAFCPDNKMYFDDVVCSAGLYITVSVRHNCHEPVPFFGVVIGELVKQ